ncbi:Cyclin-J-like protein [Manis javanica]|nr:Cyclin-J-like protein [Manis javanica]
MREARPPIPPAREGGRPPAAGRLRAAAGPGRSQGRGGGRDERGCAGGGGDQPRAGTRGQRRLGPGRGLAPAAPTPDRNGVRPESPVASDCGAAYPMMDEPWWEGRVASDVHSTLREKELKLPTFRAHSPLLKSRRFFVDILTLLSSHCQLCPAARHLAIYLLDHFLDRYNITTSKHLYAVAVSCLLLASKFEDREDHVPKLEQINSTRILSGQNFTLTKKELLSTELLLLGAFSWNLCLPTPAHFLDYYLLASVSQKDHHCHSRPPTCPRKTKECLKEYAHCFLEVALQDHIFYKFQPSVVAAACVGASRICLQLSPYWTRDLQRISNYSLEHLSTCIETLLVAYDNVLKDAVAGGLGYLGRGRRHC